MTDYRSPALAELFWGLGYVQRFGMGLPSARRPLEVNGIHQQSSPSLNPTSP
jgi:ATP-dependent DNA helicase RecG